MLVSVKPTWADVWTAANVYRTGKGFVPATWAEAGPRLCSLSAEIYEVEVALENWVKWGGAEAPNHVRDELADVALYILTLQADMGFMLLGTPRDSYSQIPHRFSGPADMTKPLRREWNQAFRFWRCRNEKDFGICLEILFAATQQLHKNLFAPVLLAEDCLSKIEKMSDRPTLHGGKDPRT